MKYELEDLARAMEYGLPIFVATKATNECLAIRAAFDNKEECFAEHYRLKQSRQFVMPGSLEYCNCVLYVVPEKHFISRSSAIHRTHEVKIPGRPTMEGYICRMLYREWEAQRKIMRAMMEKSYGLQN